MELKERIAKLRRIKNLTQAELAEKVGVTTRSIQNYELGTRVRHQLRIIPELKFFVDDSLDYIEKIDSLLK